MLHDIAIRPFPEQPAGKDAQPFLFLGRAHVELHEGARFLHLFPRRRRFAGAQPHDRIADAQRLARLHLEILRQTVALVEQADHRDAVLHRRRARQIVIHRDWIAAICGDGIGRIALRHLIRAVSACLYEQGQSQNRSQSRNPAQQRPMHPEPVLPGPTPHDASGVHAS
tara:strand:+ start:176123 stop:176629 length:507 start_codon:yes stop_codon:yes gene_type:complete